jgi:hypothetical protein
MRLEPEVRFLKKTIMVGWKSGVVQKNIERTDRGIRLPLSYSSSITDLVDKPFNHETIERLYQATRRPQPLRNSNLGFILPLFSP